MVDPELTLQDLKTNTNWVHYEDSEVSPGRNRLRPEAFLPYYNPSPISKALHLQLKYQLLDHLHVFSQHIAIWTWDKKPQAAACDWAHEHRPHPAREPQVRELVDVSSIYQC